MSSASRLARASSASTPSPSPSPSPRRRPATRAPRRARSVRRGVVAEDREGREKRVSAPAPAPAFAAPPRLARAARPEPPKEYLRLVELADGGWELQSATATFRAPRGDDDDDDDDAVEISLTSTVHVGEPSYYAALQEECDARYDAVLFELITSEENLRPGRAPPPRDADGTRRRRDKNSDSDSDDFLPALAARLSPTPDARALAEAHGLRAQLDALDLQRDRWFVADLPRSVLMRAQVEAGERGAQLSRDDASAAASAAAPPPALEALVVTATGRAGGGPARQLTRSMCWLVPCPEAHLLLLDWVWGGGRPAPALGATLDAIASGDVMAARRLAFAQMIVSAQAKGAVGGGADVPVLVLRRNDAAIECVRKAAATRGVNRIALLYGGLHMPGLTSKVMNELGYEITGAPSWRAVWKIDGPSSRSAVARSRSAVWRWAALPLLLLVDGADWAFTLSDVAASPATAAIEIGLYVVRHGAVYYGLGKWVLEWNRQLFDDRGGGGERGFS